ncbi:L-type lectin-domain containing receptor kinase S.4-like [Apium graveolens]|uniref:L-type lectin-domain containing receptor kinase S.4-like n=1 Tax=Apium graveolens TaxID=4045 RepID=UPI003D7B203D
MYSQSQTDSATTHTKWSKTSVGSKNPFKFSLPPKLAHHFTPKCCSNSNFNSIPLFNSSPTTKIPFFLLCTLTLFCFPIFKIHGLFTQILVVVVVLVELYPRFVMASTSPFRYLILLSLLLLYFRSLAVASQSSFYFNNFNKDSNFMSQLALHGDSKVVDNGLSLEFTGSSGKIIYKNPIKLLEVKTKSLVSLSTNFSFSLAQVYGNGLTLFMVPVRSVGLLDERKVRLFSVQFDLSIDAKHSDANGNDVACFVSVKVSNVSSVKLVLDRGDKLQAWIDYEVSSKRLEVRLIKLGHIKPVDPVLSYSIDLALMWKENEVLVGLGSIPGNSSQLCNVYSWGFRLRQVPHLMHSQPLDPEVHVEEKKASIVQKRSDCLTKILAALIFGTGCGALGAIFALFVWTIFGENGRAILPEDYAVQPVKIEYKKFEVAIDKQKEGDKQ